MLAGPVRSIDWLPSPRSHGAMVQPPALLCAALATAGLCHGCAILLARRRLAPPSQLNRMAGSQVLNGPADDSRCTGPTPFPPLPESTSTHRHSARPRGVSHGA